MIQRLLHRLDDGTIFDQRFNHPAATRFVDIDNGGMAELAVDIPDARDRGAVMLCATDKQHVAGAKGERFTGIERRMHECIVGRLAEGTQRRVALGCDRVTPVDLSRHIGGIAQQPQGIAHRMLRLAVHQVMCAPSGDPVANGGPDVEHLVHHKGRKLRQIRTREAGKIALMHVVIDTREIANDIVCGFSRRFRQGSESPEIAGDLVFDRTPLHNQIPAPIPASGPQWVASRCAPGRQLVHEL